VTLPGFEKIISSTSKNVTIFLELGTNVTISSHRDVIFLGSACNKTGIKHKKAERIVKYYSGKTVGGGAARPYE